MGGDYGRPTIYKLCSTVNQAMFTMT